MSPGEREVTGFFRQLEERMCPLYILHSARELACLRLRLPRAQARPVLGAGAGLV